MKKYCRPQIIEEDLEIIDIVAKSFGEDQAGDKIVDFLGNE